MALGTTRHRFWPARRAVHGLRPSLMKEAKAPGARPMVVVGHPTYQAVRRAEDRSRWIGGGERRSMVWAGGDEVARARITPGAIQQR